MPCLVSLTGKDDDFQSLSWATWATAVAARPPNSIADSADSALAHAVKYARRSIIFYQFLVGPGREVPVSAEMQPTCC